PIVDSVYDDLRQLVDEQGEGPVFRTTRKPHKQVTVAESFRRSWIAKARATSGYPEQFGWHSLRHYAITSWVNAGGKRADVSRIADGRATSGYPRQFGWHSLRHNASTSWVNAGGKPADVSRIAGHHSVQFTINRYYGADNTHVDAIRELLSSSG